MPFESLKASIYLLLEDMTNQPEDLHALQEELREKISELRSLGLPIPDDLEQAEKDLSRNLKK
ncbi:MAG: hypothetical protein QM492_09755 [Rhodobacterales bacterium]